MFKDQWCIKLEKLFEEAKKRKPKHELTAEDMDKLNTCLFS